ncbi:hypothetical protein [Streptomyces californicus]|uniref:hypothetical protein n=1 Tax=Streptomyces californicus TaxID=67351 RepID=UPI00067BEEF2|nr:hypothetical protein [Streptomyces californicus]QRV56637.1 hypothetical protein I6J40_22380 [Streptomyces californicus]
MDEIARINSEPLLTAEDIAHRLAAIHAAQNDDERAHGMEDDLHRDVLAAIAVGAPDASLLAAAALRTETLDFARWCG